MDMDMECGVTYSPTPYFHSEFFLSREPGRLSLQLISWAQRRGASPPVLLEPGRALVPRTGSRQARELAFACVFVRRIQFGSFLEEPATRRAAPLAPLVAGRTGLLAAAGYGDELPDARDELKVRFNRDAGTASFKTPEEYAAEARAAVTISRGGYQDPYAPVPTAQSDAAAARQAAAASLCAVGTGAYGAW